MQIEVILAAVYGLVLGSFLNVCIYRFVYELALTKPARSMCPRCMTPIAWSDNIPVLSYLLLGGKCRQCRSAIAWRYPMVEILTSVAFAAAIVHHGATPEGYKLCLYSFLMIGCIFSDLEDRILPDEFTLGGMAIGLTLACIWALPEPKILPLVLWSFGLPRPFLNLLEAGLGAALPTGIMYVVGVVMSRLKGRDALGFGDVKMVAMMGAFYGLGPTLVAVAIGSVLGLVIGLPYILLSRNNYRTYEIPYGSFLGAAALIQQYLLRSTSGVH
jgi:leader peptidase (prepilin peptidase) / N-methyltransferase